MSLLEILAGSGYANEVQTGQAAKIMTGAPIPPGADTVIMREQSQLDENGSTKAVLFSVDNEFKVGQNVRQAGEDLAQNSVVFKQGTRITSPELGMLASLGISHIPVYLQLKVAVFSTGDEVQAPGEALNDHCIYDSNRFTVMAQLERTGLRSD